VPSPANLHPLDPLEGLRMCFEDKRLQMCAGLVAVCLSVFATAPARAQGWNVELLSNFAPYGTRAYNDCWGYSAPDGTEIAILGLSQGVAFVDVTDPRRPLEVGFFLSEPATHRDFRTHGEYAYEVNESSGGLRIYDLSDPRFPVFAGAWEETFTSAHNIGIYDGFAYVVGAQKDGKVAGTRILDLSDPERPVEVGFYAEHYVHDIYVRDDVAYMATIQREGFTVVDVSDKSNPRQLVYRPYSGANTHNSWLSKNGDYLLTTDETGGGHLRIWDTQSWMQVNEWSAHPNASIHNVIVKGDSAYISYYTEGFQVVDISNPEVPIPVASYDTWPGVSDGFNGAWGVYPFANSGNIYVSDISSGLYVFRLVDGGPVADFDLSAPSYQIGRAGQTLLFSFDLLNRSQSGTWYDIVATNDHAWTVSAPERLFLGGNSSTIITTLVSVPMDIVDAIEVNVELCVTSRATGRNVCVSTDVATPVLLQAFATRAAPGGVSLEWQLDWGPDDHGEVVILRAPSVTPAARVERARLPLGSGSWFDPEVRAGGAYLYSLAVQMDAGLSILAEREVAVAVPGRSLLLGNTPNPFNPATHIRFDLAQPGDVALRIYDSRGRLVRTLAKPALVPGRHEVLWNGLDQAGNPQATGVYFYEIRSPRWSARGRMVLLR